jgi:ribonuclease R
VHRLLRAVRRGAAGPAPLEDELAAIAAPASQRERRAVEAERELVQWKKARFMADKLGEEFDGYVTGVTAFGLFVEIVEPFVEGLVHVATMGDDDYRFVEAAHVLHGTRTRRVYRLGDRVRVRVLRVDADRRMIDLGLAGPIDAGRDGATSPRRGARRAGTRASDRRRHTPRQPPRGRMRQRR